MSRRYATGLLLSLMSGLLLARLLCLDSSVASAAQSRDGKSSKPPALGTRAGSGRAFKMALPGYQFSFPRDYAAHEDYKTEWWYYTGHLKADDGTRYGYELTFFRVAMDVPDGVKAVDPLRQKVNTWAVDDVYLAHFAVSDLAARQFFHSQQLTRAGVGFAGARQDVYRVWNRNWSVEQAGDTQKVKAISSQYGIALTLTPVKPLVLHGEDGVSQKAGCVGCASHYYSFTRLGTQGVITVNGRRLKVNGTTWMDHEFGSNQLTAEQVGWDWFSVQLNDNTELMLYVMRRRDGSIDVHSSGTYVASDGAARHLGLRDYAISHQGTWHSRDSGATYPMGWQVTLPSRRLCLTIKPDMLDQELTRQGGHDVTYWEGACTVSGVADGKAIEGQAYVEMTGYASAFSNNI